MRAFSETHYFTVGTSVAWLSSNFCQSILIGWQSPSVKISLVCSACKSARILLYANTNCSAAQPSSSRKGTIMGTKHSLAVGVIGILELLDGWVGRRLRRRRRPTSDACM